MPFSEHALRKSACSDVVFIVYLSCVKSLRPVATSQLYVIHKTIPEPTGHSEVWTNRAWVRLSAVGYGNLTHDSSGRKIGRETLLGANSIGNRKTANGATSHR